MADEQLSVRDKRQRDRLEKMRKMQGTPRVRVLPRDDEIRKNIQHPIGWIGFPESGSVEWPDDGFTRRRIADGDVTLEEVPSESKRKSGAQQS